MSTIISLRSIDRSMSLPLFTLAQFTLSRANKRVKKNILKDAPNLSAMTQRLFARFMRVIVTSARRPPKWHGRAIKRQSLWKAKAVNSSSNGVRRTPSLYIETMLSRSPRSITSATNYKHVNNTRKRCIRYRCASISFNFDIVSSCSSLVTFGGEKKRKSSRKCTNDTITLEHYRDSIQQQGMKIRKIGKINHLMRDNAFIDNALISEKRKRQRI